MFLHPLPWVDGLVTAEVVVTGGTDDPWNDLPEDLRASSPFRDLTPDRRAAMRRETVEMLPEIVSALHRHLLDLNEENARFAPTYVRQAPKVGRNEPCPCGSGKKYKKCCLGNLESED
jgi:hypothetical protein